MKSLVSKPGLTICPGKVDSISQRWFSKEHFVKDQRNLESIFVVFQCNFCCQKIFQCFEVVVTDQRQRKNLISIGNSMICSDIWHKYHE